MIAIDVRPARRWFSNRRQWQYLITATNGEPISEKDTYANISDIEDIWRKIVASDEPVQMVVHHPLPPNCVQQYWLYGLRGTTRTLCDGPIRADGSWERRRNFYADARYVPVTCSWNRWGGGCSGGYTLPVFDTGVESYIVTPATVLNDEPGHLGNAGVVR